MGPQATKAWSGGPSVPVLAAATSSAGGSLADPGLQWVNITSQLPQPGNRSDAALAYDSTAGYVVMFGGENPYNIPVTYYSDTWTFLNGQWTNVTATAGTAPSPRWGFGLADDPANGGVVLFGGGPQKGPAELNDTWVFADGQWKNITASIGPAPPPLYWGAMAYDNQTESVILFGGHTASSTYTNETWSFNGDSWTELTPVTSPPARNSESLVYDAHDGYLLMFGGQNESYLNDTWSYSAGDWSPIPSSTAPDPRLGAGIAYDSGLSEVVLFGGYPANEHPLATYTYSAGTWTIENLSPGPPQSTVSDQMTYDASNQYVVLLDARFGNGAGSTWILNGTSAPPPPTLSVTATVTPQAGFVPLHVSFTSQVSGGTPPYVVTWDFGDSSSNDSGSPAAAGNTTHTYSTVGVYTSALLVNDSAHQSVLKYWTITVSVTPLTLSISASTTHPEVNQSVSFTSTPSGGTPPYTFAWTFGDGGTATTQNATHAYAKAGTFTAILLVTDHLGNTVSKNVSILVMAIIVGPTASDTWLYIVGALVIIIVAIVIVVWYRRRKKPPPAVPVPQATPSPADGPTR